MRDFEIKLLDRLVYHPLPWMRRKPGCLCYRCDPDLFAWMQAHSESKAGRVVTLTLAIINGLLALWNVAMAVLVHRWWSLANVAAACFGGTIAIVQFQRWRKTWDSPKPPTSKSSLPSQAPYTYRFPNPPSPSPSVNPSPHKVLTVTSLPSGLPIATTPLQRIAVDMPVVGFRSWTISGTRLRSINQEAGVWHAGINRAICVKSLAAAFVMPRAGEPHETPDPQCACGLYARHTPSVADRAEKRYVTGAVLGWGRLIRHAHEGFRAEYMRPICLAEPARDDYQTFVTEGPLCPRAKWENDHLVVEWSDNGSLALSGQPAGSTYTLMNATVLSTGHLVPDGQKACQCGAVVTRSLPDNDWGLLMLGRMALAESLNLPLVPGAHLEAYASEFGQSIKGLAKESA